MDYQAYIARLKQLADELGKDPHFKTIVEFERPFTDDEFDDLQALIDGAGIAQLAVWDEFKRFYGATNGFLFQWLYKGDKKVTVDTASAEISPVQAIYLPEYLKGEQLKKFYGERRAFDRISPDDQVALIFDTGRAAPNLHFFDDATGKFYPMRLDFQEYLETLLEARAMYGWQKFFVDAPGFTFTKEDAQAFRDSLHTLFPSANVALFRARGE